MRVILSIYVIGLQGCTLHETTLSPVIMEVNNGCISDRIVTFQTARPFALNHDYGRKGNSEFTPENSCLEDFRLFLGGISATDSPA